MKLSSLFFCFSFFLLAGVHESARAQTFQSPLSKRIVHAFVSSDNQTVLAADTEGYVFSWRKADGSISKILRAHNPGFIRMAVSGGSKYFATSALDSKIFLWDFETGEKTSELFLGYPSASLSFTRDNKFLIYTSGNTVYKAAVSDLNTSVSFYQSEFAISCGALVNRGNYFAIGSGNTVLLLNAADGKVITQTTTCAGLRFIESSANQLCAVCADGTAQLFELKDAAFHKKNETNIPFSTAMQLLLLPEEKNVLFTTEAGNMQIWDWVSNKLFQAEGLQQSITALGSAGQMMITGSKDGQVVISTPPSAHGEDVKTFEKAAMNAPITKSLNERPVRFQEPVEVQSLQLDIYVWDDENIDGDTISLSLNGEWILENHLVTKEKKKITLALVPDKKNTLVLYAENLGTSPPNTAVIFFNDGNKERTLTLSSDLKRCDAVNFILKK